MQTAQKDRNAAYCFMRGNKMDMKTRKAQGLSLTVVIVAVIVLIVLVVLVVILTGRTGRFAEGTKEVSEEYSGERCAIPGTGRGCYAEPCPSGMRYVGVFDCEGNQICCQ